MIKTSPALGGVGPGSRLKPLGLRADKPACGGAMGMIDRYRKPGGFVQLLNLLETCGPAKQEKFLEIIRTEDPLWADILVQKMLSMKLIFSWDMDLLAQIVMQLSDLTIGTALAGSSEAEQEKLRAALRNSRLRKIEERSIPEPTAAELNTVFVRIITEVRTMIMDGVLRGDQIGSHMLIDPKIEDRLKNRTILIPDSEELISGGNPSNANDIDEDDLRRGGKVIVLDFSAVPGGGSAVAVANSVSGTAAAGPVSASANDRDDVIQLRKKLSALTQENQNLKSELTRMRAKLEQIRKIV